MDEKKDTEDEESKIPLPNNLLKSKKLYLYITFAVVVSIMLLFSYYILNRRYFSIENQASNKYKVLIVSDRDKFSLNKRQWESRLLKGTLYVENGEYKMIWEKNVNNLLQGKYVEGSRGMELSELQYWNGKLYTFCDRTGIVYEIVNEKLVIPRHILAEGDGISSQKGFKSEWATVKDSNLYVGSIGKEWTTPKGEIINYSPMFIKIIDRNGYVQHVDWKSQYNALRAKVGASYPGYIVHEAFTWSDIHKKWFILPRRVSDEPYDEEDETKRGSNLLLIANEDFSDIDVKRIGKKIPQRGFSTLKFIPGRPSDIIALKTEEKGSEMKSYFTIFNVEGRILVNETEIVNEKFEGLEISPIYDQK